MASANTMPWIEDGSIWQGADMWARPEESSEYIIGLYRRACAHADRVIAALDLETPGSVAHWPADRRDTTLGVLLIRMVAETAQHAGHADIVRELIDGKGGPDQDAFDESACGSTSLRSRPRPTRSLAVAARVRARRLCAVRSRVGSARVRAPIARFCAGRWTDNPHRGR